MPVSLAKGGNISLTKEAGSAGLSNVTVGLGWDARTTTGDAFDLDASAILCNDTGKARTDGDFVFYGNLTSSDGTVKHQGDERTGDTAGDDEQIKVGLGGVAADVDKIVFSASIYEAEQRKQSFGQVRKAFIRVVNDSDGTELARYDLSEDASTESAMVFGELYRSGAEWKFRAVGQGLLQRPAWHRERLRPQRRLTRGAVWRIGPCVLLLLLAAGVTGPPAAPRRPAA